MFRDLPTYTKMQVIKIISFIIHYIYKIRSIKEIETKYISMVPFETVVTNGVN